VFGFSDTWQLVINRLTTLVTFVMVFVIQSSPNPDARVENGFRAGRDSSARGARTHTRRRTGYAREQHRPGR
jgi:low affinity Fe/Cu permease